jgi:hypothetical protein
VKLRPIPPLARKVLYSYGRVIDELLPRQGRRQVSIIGLGAAMYREIPRTVGITEASVYDLDGAEKALRSRESASLPHADSDPVTGDQPEALFAALSLGALVIIILGSLLHAWM